MLGSLAPIKKSVAIRGTGSAILTLQCRIMPDGDDQVDTGTSIPAVHRSWLQGAAKDLRSWAYRSARDMVQAGLILKEAREKCGKKRTFNRWCTTEFPWSRSHCYRLMKVAEVFAPLIGDVERIEITALYLLTRSDVKEETRALVAEIAKDRVVTVADAKQLLAMRPQGELRKGEIRKYESSVKEVRESEATPLPNEPWRLLEELVIASTVVHISKNGAEDQLVSITVYPEQMGKRPRHVVRETLSEAIIAAAMPTEREKVCPGCQQTKRFSQFCSNTMLADGRNRLCKACENARMRQRKAQKRAATSNAPRSRGFGYGAKDPAQPTDG